MSPSGFLVPSPLYQKTARKQVTYRQHRTIPVYRLHRRNFRQIVQKPQGILTDFRGFLDDLTEYSASKMCAGNCAVLPEFSPRNKQGRWLSIPAFSLCMIPKPHRLRCARSGRRRPPWLLRAGEAPPKDAVVQAHLIAVHFVLKEKGEREEKHRNAHHDAHPSDFLRSSLSSDSEQAAPFCVQVQNLIIASFISLGLWSKWWVSPDRTTSLQF